MGDLAAWLGAIHKTCGALLGPLDDEYGIDEVEDLVNLEPQHVDHLVDMLKMNPGKKFRAALEALAIDAALPNDAAGAGPKPIPEAIPPEATVNLHTVGQPPADLDGAAGAAPEPELLPSPPSVAATTPPPQPEHRRRQRRQRRSAGRYPKGGGFGSMRFDGVVPQHAQQLKQGMNELGADMNIINMAGGGDIDLAVQEGILDADAFIVFGSAKYGEDTGNAACTYYESKFAQSQRKKIILIRMIPFDEEFVFPQAKFIFGLNMLELPWMLGTPMPPDLPRLVVEAMEAAITPRQDQAQDEQAPEPELLPASPSPSAAAATPAQMDSLAELAAAARCSEAEVLALAEAELAELLVELQVGVIARKRLVAHMARARAEAAQLAADKAAQLAADEAEARRLQGVEAAQARASQLQAEARHADAQGVCRLLAAPGVDAPLATVCCQRVVEISDGGPNKLAAEGTTFIAAGGCKALVAAMRSHIAVANLQAEACHALRNLSRSDEGRAAVRAAGGAEAVVGALRAHVGVAAVQEWGCAAACRLTFKSAEGIAAVLVAAGGAEAVVGALRAHVGVAAVQEWGCRAVNNLVYSAEGPAAVLAAGGAEAVVGALRAHVGVAAVQEVGCRAAWSLAAKSAEGRAALRRLGAAELAQAARRNHPTHGGVQEMSAGLLRTL